MNQEVKKKWVSALRSGEFKQGKHYLSTESGHCCLGVLCVLAEKEGVVSSRLEDAEDELAGAPKGKRVYGEWSSKSLPMEVLTWAGLTFSSPAVATEVRGIFMPLLADLNDAGTPFEEIAALIEDQSAGWDGGRAKL